MSMIRMTMLSSIPFLYPDMDPMSVPKTKAMDTETTDTIKEILAPYIKRDKISLPRSSVPKRYFVVPPSCQMGGLSWSYKDVSKGS